MGADALIVGKDLDGAHIFVVRDGQLSCEDAVGFAAIGMGSWHAESHLVSSGYAKTKPFPEMLYLAYAAKRRAEVAPGIGKETDIFTVGPDLGMSTLIQPQVLTVLKGMYDAVDQALAKSMAEAMRDWNAAILSGIGEAITKAAKTRGEQSTGDSPPGMPLSEASEEGDKDEKDEK